MANVFAKPNAIVNTILGMLLPELILPRLVWLNGIGDFAGKYQDTISIRIPNPTDAHTRPLRGTGNQRNLTVSDLTETTIDVKLTDDVYNLILLTDEEKTLDILSFADQVLRRQVLAVSQSLESGISSVIQSAPYTDVNSVDADSIWNGVIGARRQLNDAFIPRDGRVLIIGSAVEEALLLDDRFVRYDSAGQDGANRLQEANVGRLASQQVVVCDTIPHGAAYLFHPTAFVMVSRPPSAPFSNTVAVAAAASDNGIALRWLGDYDSTSTTDRSLVDTFVGYSTVIDPGPDALVRATRIQLKAVSGSTTLGNQGAVTAAAGANHTRQATLVDTNSDDRAADTGTVVWASSDPTKATVSTTGLVTGVATGATNITATLDGFTKTWALTVT